MVVSTPQVSFEELNIQIVRTHKLFEKVLSVALRNKHSMSSSAMIVMALVHLWVVNEIYGPLKIESKNSEFLLDSRSFLFLLFRIKME